MVHRGHEEARATVSGNFSGVGIASGLDLASLINSLLAADAQRRVPLETRIATIAQTRAALQQSRSLLLGLRGAASALALPSTLSAKSVTSTNPNSLLATVLGGANPPASGMTSLLVRSLAHASRIASSALSLGGSALGATGGVLRFGTGRLVDDRPLALLRGGDGIPRGRIRIRDGDGDQAIVDLRAALSIDDVLREINGHASLDVEARLRPDGRGLELVDLSGGTGTLTIEEWGGGSTAAALGVLGVDGDGDGVVVGATISHLGAATPLWSLRGGVPIGEGEPDFVIVANGIEIPVSLAAGAGGVPPRAATLGQALDRIEDAIGSAGLGGELAVTIAPDGDRLRVSWSGVGEVSFLPAPGATPKTPSAIAALGLPASALTGSGDGAAPALADGARLDFGLHDVGLDRLDGGAGLQLSGSLTITDRSGVVAVVDDLASVDSIESLMARLRAAIDATPGMQVEVSLDADGSRIRIVDQGGGTGALSVTGAAAGQLGFAALANGWTGASSGAVAQSRDLRRADIGWGTPLDRVAGASVEGTIKITTAAGASAIIAVKPGMTVADLRRAVESSGLPISLGINGFGDAIEIVDLTGAPGTLVAADESGNAAASLGIAGSSSSGRLDGTRTIELALDGTESAADLAALLESLDGVDAEFTADGSGTGTLIVTASKTGIRHSVVLSLDGVDLGFASLVSASDARVILSPEAGPGTLVTSDTNVITSAIPGLSLQLLALSDDAVTVTVSPSFEPLIGAVSAFASALATAVANIRSATAVDVDAGTRGALYGNSTASRAREALRALVGRTFGPDGTRLSALGITVGADGAVLFDESVLASALESDPDAVRAMLAEEGGVAERFETLLGALVDPSSGAFDGDDERLARLSASALARIDRIDAAIERKRALLVARFGAMEATIERLRWQQSVLQSLVSSLGSNA